MLANNVSVDNGINSPRTVGNLRVDSTSITGATLDYDLVFLFVQATYRWDEQGVAALRSAPHECLGPLAQHVGAQRGCGYGHPFLVSSTS